MMESEDVLSGIRPFICLSSALHHFSWVVPSVPRHFIVSYLKNNIGSIPLQLPWSPLPLFIDDSENKLPAVYIFSSLLYYSDLTIKSRQPFVKSKGMFSFDVAITWTAHDSLVPPSCSSFSSPPSTSPSYHFPKIHSICLLFKFLSLYTQSNY